MGGEVQSFVLRGAAGDLPTLHVLPLDHHFTYLPDVPLIPDPLQLALPIQ